jgi:hypothetical protein
VKEHRQKILLAIFGAMAVLTVGDRLWQDYYVAPLEAAQTRASKLTQGLAETRQTLKRYKKQQQRLDALRKLSLPGDVEAARTLYQEWLTEVAEKIELEGLRVDSNAPRTSAGFRELPFSLRCIGTLEQLTALLHTFYQAPLLHHISTLAITPIAGTRQLSLNFAIQALQLDNTPPASALPTGQRNQLASTTLEEYQMIAQRNIFSTSGGVEAAHFTVLTAIVAVDGYPQAWFTNLLEDHVAKVRVGERFRVGALECVVAEIGLRDVILSIQGQRWLLSVNDGMAAAIALPPEY